MVRCRLSELLGREKMHIRELARESGISYPTLWNLYHEKTTMVSLNTIDKICEALGIQVGDLFEFVKETTTKRKD